MSSSRPARRALQWTPERFETWAKCPRMAVATVPGCRFLPFKTPLSTAHETIYGGEANCFTVDMFMQRTQRSQLRVALVIDATGEPDGTFLHNVREWEEWDVQLVKLFHHGCGSSDGAPSPGMASDFIRICQDFLSKDATSVIGVFDEYGCNRSLTLIASYLILKDGMTPDEAIETVKPLRPPTGIYDAACFTMLKAVIPTSLTPPSWDSRTKEQREAWPVVSEPYATRLLTAVEVDSGAVKLCVDGSGWIIAASKAFAAPPLPPPVKRARVDAAPSTATVAVMPEPGPHIHAPSTLFTHPFAFASMVVPTSPLYDWTIATLRQGLALKCPLVEVSGRLFHTPVELDVSSHLKPELRDGSLHVMTWNAVGEGFTVLLTPRGLVFVTLTSVWMHPCDLPPSLHGTIAQGVAVIETLPDSSKIHRLLLDDALIVAGKVLTARPLFGRLGYLRDHVLNPLKQHLEKSVGSAVPFRIRTKEHVVPAKLDKLLDILPQLPHAHDGILILCGTAPSHFLCDVSFPLPLGQSVLHCPSSGATFDALKEFVTK